MSKPTGKKKCLFENLLPLNIDLKLLIADTKLGNDFEILSKGEYELLWSTLTECLSVILKREKTESDELILLEAMILIDNALNNNSSRAGLCTEIFHLLSVLNDNVVLNEDCEDLRLKINTSWIKNNFAVVPGMVQNTYERYMEMLKTDVQVIKKLYSLRGQLTSDIILTQAEAIKNSLINPKIIGIETGQKFFAHVCRLSENLVELIMKTISFDLRECSKEKAGNYGATILSSLRKASDEVIPVFKNYLQNMMESFIKVPRKKLELPTLSRNLMIVISCWNVEVHHKTSDSFILLMTECYQPIIWKYLESGINFERVNAADLFMKAFPLQIPGDAVKNSDLFNKQLEYMEVLLRDDCHIVRIIAVTEICNILALYWTQFTTSQIGKLLKIIFTEHAKDTSSFEVRKSVWRSIQQFINSEPAYKYLKKVLPGLGGHLYDSNQFVKVEFVKLLIAIRKKNDPEFKYSKVVTKEQLLELLVEENILVGSVIVQLLMRSCYQPGMPFELFIQKLCYLITNYPKDCVRKFFFYSKKSLSFDDAYFIISELMRRIGKYVVELVVKADKENDENNSSNENVSQNQSMFEKNKSLSDDTAFTNPDVVAGIFEVIGILWLIHSKQLHDENKKKLLEELQGTFIRFAPAFISYYKGCELFQSIVALSANIPPKILAAGNITLPSYCLKKIRTVKIDGDPAENEEKWVLLLSLVLWERSDTILDQIFIWIQAAFEEKEDVVTQAVKRVKICDSDAPNPDLAIHLLNLLLEKDISRDKLLRKHHKQLIEIFRAMKPIQKCVVQRLRQQRPFPNSLLNDKFLETCFQRFGKLIPVLSIETKSKDIVEKADNSMEDENEECFDSISEMNLLILWAKENMVIELQSEECPDLPLLVSVLNGVLYTAGNMIYIGKSNEEMCKNLVELLVGIFCMEYKLPFIKEASRIGRALEFNAERTEKGDYMWFNLIPKVVCDSFNAMVSRPYTANDLSPFKQDFKEVKINIKKIIDGYVFFWTRRVSKKAHDHLKTIAYSAILSIQTVLMRDIPNENMGLSVYSSINGLNLAVGTIMSIFYAEQVLTSLFLSVLKENLGSTVKILLADLVILNVFARCKNRKWCVDVNTVATEIATKLKLLKPRGTNETLGMTLNYVEAEDEDNHGNLEIPSSQIISAAVMPRSSEAENNNNMATGTRESCTDTNMATGTRESCTDTNMATGTKESCTDTNMATGQATRESALNDVAANFAAIRISDPMNCNDELCPPSSQPLTQCSNFATQGSQPIRQIDVPVTPKRAEKINEDILINDFVVLGEELLRNIKTALIPPSGSTT